MRMYYNYRPTKDKIHIGYFDLYFLLSALFYAGGHTKYV